MSDRQQDPELRTRFDAMRRVDASRAPVFADVLARARAEAESATDPARTTEWRLTRRIELRRLGWAGGLAAAAVIAALIVIPRAISQEDAFERAVRSFQTSPALGGWRAPTDALLDLPGRRLMSTIPGVSAGQQ